MLAERPPVMVCGTGAFPVDIPVAVYGERDIVRFQPVDHSLIFRIFQSLEIFYRSQQDFSRFVIL
ncbi:hypothetical protein D3C75_769030 [compost metagenome]